MVLAVDLWGGAVRFGLAVLIHTEVHLVPRAAGAGARAVVVAQSLVPVCAAPDRVVTVVSVVYAAVSLRADLFLAAAPA